MAFPREPGGEKEKKETEEAEEKAEMTWPMLYPKPYRVMYVYAVILMTLFAGGFLFFIVYAALQPLILGITTHMAGMEQESTSPTFDLANAFMQAILSFFLVFMCIGLLYYVYIYSQRKGTPMVLSE